MRTKYFFCSAMALFFLFGCVAPQSFEILETRVAALETESSRQLDLENEESKKAALQREQIKLESEKDIEDIKNKLNGSRILSPEEYAELKYDIQTIKEDLRRLQGLIEEINHNFERYSETGVESIDQRLERLDHAISKNYEKVVRLETYMGFEPTAATQNEEVEGSKEEPKKNAEQELYDSAKKLLDEGDRENARIQFENFINKYPDSKNADNARFWIADSYFSEKWYEKAILEYQRVLEEYPKGNKLAAARLKQGYAFAELGEKANARLILKELIKKHPDSNEAKYAQEKLKSLK